MNLNSLILGAAAKSQEELTGSMEGSPDDQMYVGQKCQDMTEEKEEAGQRDFLEEIPFTERELKEKEEMVSNMTPSEWRGKMKLLDPNRDEVRNFTMPVICFP